MMKKVQGFTLVEIALVLVIVGLLLGSVLKGQEIIANAKIKNIENSFNSIVQAISIYQERYHALPGDDGQVESRFNFTDNYGNGDADGIIEGDYVRNQDEDEETGKVWRHLRAARLITGSSQYTSDNIAYQGPINAFSGKTGIGMRQYGISWIFVGFTQIPPKIAIIFEERHDGVINPQDGRIRAEDNQTLIGENNYNNYAQLNILFSL